MEIPASSTNGDISRASSACIWLDTNPPTIISLNLGEVILAHRPLLESKSPKNAMHAVAKQSKQISLYSITEVRWKHEGLQNLSNSTPEQKHSHGPGSCVKQHRLLLPFTGPHSLEATINKVPSSLERHDFSKPPMQSCQTPRSSWKSQNCEDFVRQSTDSGRKLAQWRKVFGFLDCTVSAPDVTSYFEVGSAGQNSTSA